MAAAVLVGSVDASEVRAFEVHTDPRGDVPGAPDILVVKVANDVVARSVDFRVEYADQVEERGTIWLDTDEDAATGAPGRGSDYRITWDPFRYELERWNGTSSAFDVVTPGAMVGLFARAARSSVAFSVPEEDLGTPLAVALSVELVRGVATDVAPNSGSWRYAVNRARLRLSVASSRVAAPPRARRQFSLSVVVMRSDLGERLVGGAVACTAFAGATRLRGIATVVPRCTWTIPRNARGRTLRATIRVSFGGASTSKTVRLRIR